MQKEVSINIIEKIEQLVENACRSDKNIFGYGIWTHHIKFVSDKAKELAFTFNADPEIVEIAALLHDYAGIIDNSLHNEHHTHSAIMAGEILKKLRYPKQKIEAVQHCIENHRGSIAGLRKTPEAECLANADAIAHIENIPSLLYLTFVQFKMENNDGTDWVRKKIERSYNKLNPILQDEMQHKYQAALSLLNSF
jgi:uncharacterized protein